MIYYSGGNPCIVSKQCYQDIELCLEEWYDSQENPFRNYFENGIRVSQEYVVDKFDLVVMDHREDHIQVMLQSKENSGYIPFKQVFHVNDGELSPDTDKEVE